MVYRRVIEIRGACASEPLCTSPSQNSLVIDKISIWDSSQDQRFNSGGAAMHV